MQYDAMQPLSNYMKIGYWVAMACFAAQDCDDDGENAAGGRLLHLLQVAGAEDVVVVVSRWCASISAAHVLGA